MTVIKNYMYNLLYEVMALIVPLVLTPYVSRVLGVDGIGKYSVSVAISSYFVLFGMLGINMYGSRQIAYVCDDEKELRKTFWEITFLKTISMGLSIIVFCIIIPLIVSKDRIGLNYVQIITLIASLFDISWLFAGLEAFKKTAMRNIIVKLIGVILVLILVKDKGDLVKYAIIMSGTNAVGQAILWAVVPKELKTIDYDKRRLKYHLKQTLNLWLPSIAVTIYASLDKIMLGYLSGDVQTGLYESAQKIVKMISVISTSFTTAALPRMANLHNKKDNAALAALTNRSLTFISFIVVPLSFGLFAIRETIVPWFFGTGYEAVSNMLMISAWLLIILAFNSVLGRQVLIARGKEKCYNIAIITNLCINVTLNICLIPMIKANGALIASVTAELVGLLIMYLYSHKLFGVNLPLMSISRYILISAFMSIIVYIIGYFLGAHIYATLIQIIFGGFLYVGALYLLKDPIIMFIIHKAKDIWSARLSKI